MPRLIDSELCQHCGKPVPEPKPRACPHCGGSQQRRFLSCGCLTSAPPVILIGCLLAFHQAPTAAPTANPIGAPSAALSAGTDSVEHAQAELESQAEAPLESAIADLSPPQLRKSP